MIRPEETVFCLKQDLLQYLEENKDAYARSEDSTNKANKKMDDILDMIVKAKMKQDETLKDNYTREYIKASNEYTE